MGFKRMSPPIIIAIVLGVATIFLLRQRMSSQFVDSAQAHRLVEDGARLIDVRSPSEYASGHIDGARNIPLDQIGSRTNDVGRKDAPVVVYCRSGMRSAQAKSKLEAAGFTQVYNLGGMSRW